MKTFEQYLEELHAKDYHGVDDDMPEDFNNWLDGIEQWQLIDMADDYVREERLTAKNEEYARVEHLVHVGNDEIPF